KAVVELALDGRKVSALAGETVLQVARREGIDIPRLCHHDDLPAGNCRACVVEVEGERVLAASCCRAVAPGRGVRTAGGRAGKARAMVVELLVSDAGETERFKPDSELAKWSRQLGVAAGRLPRRSAAYATADASHAAIEVNLDACIQCTR